MAYTYVAFGRVQAFPMYGALGMSAPSLHRESTELFVALIIQISVLHFHSFDHIRLTTKISRSTVPVSTSILKSADCAENFERWRRTTSIARVSQC